MPDKVFYILSTKNIGSDQGNLFSLVEIYYSSALSPLPLCFSQQSSLGMFCWELRVVNDTCGLLDLDIPIIQSRNT